MILANTPLRREDFDRCNWQEVIAHCDKRECLDYYELFFAKAREAEEAGDTTTHGIFTLLGAITSLLPKLDSEDEPFGPLGVFGSSRTASLDDLTDAHLDALKEMAPHVTDAEMRARIADILWVKRRDFRMAGLAIEAYLESAQVLEHPEKWPPCADRIERAMRLAASLGRNSAYFPKTIAYAEALLNKYNGEDPSFLSAKLMKILQEQRHGNPRKYIAFAEQAAIRAETQRAWHKARTYWEITAQWHVLDKDNENKRVALQRAAETYVQEAEDAISQPSSGYLAASSHLHKAIEALRRISGTQERVNELHRRLLAYEKQALEEFKPVSQEIDLGGHIEKARGLVKGKTIEEALLTLATMGTSPKVAHLRKQIQEMVQKHPLQYFVSTVMVNQAGKVIRRRPSMRLDDPDEAEAALRSEMFSQAVIHQQVHAQATVEPARQQIIFEHAVRVDDLFPIVLNNPFVPEGRQYTYARGLHAGLMGDFLVATHLLIPQLENSIRYLLSQHGAFSSGIDSQGIQEERDLNTIFSLPQMRTIVEKIFGEDLTVDLQGLLVERSGSNLRNLLAHGLIDHDHFFSPRMSYLWWLTLRLCCLPILIQLSRDQMVTDTD